MFYKMWDNLAMAPAFIQNGYENRDLYWQHSIIVSPSKNWRAIFLSFFENLSISVSVLHD